MVTRWERRPLGWWSTCAASSAGAAVVWGWPPPASESGSASRSSVRFELKVEEFTDVTYAVAEGGGAVITIDPPDRDNAFGGRTVADLIAAFKPAWADSSVAAVILTGAGDQAFCAGGDVKERAATGGYGETEWGTFEIERLHRIIRDIPKPVIAAVNGVAVGGGHVLHVLCDLSIAATHARFGQSGPKVGSFDAGFGSAYLARVVGEKRARQIWFLLDLYDAETAERWGLVHEVVPADQLLATALAWGRKIGSYSPTALRFLKHSFNADTDHIGGLSHLAFDGLELFAHSDEGMEGARAFAEKRPPDFRRFR